MRRMTGRGREGHAVIEVALLSPWIFFLFAGVFDFGFYSYAAICTANAARTAALRTAASAASAGDSAAACEAALEELRMLPNVASGVTGCSALPVQVTATAVPVGLDGAPASRVAVTYQSVQLFRIPGLMDRMTMTRVAEMRVQRD
jgi:Flp pilus assembly protein TadG